MSEQSINQSNNQGKPQFFKNAAWQAHYERAAAESAFIRSLTPQRQYLLYGRMFKNSRLSSTAKK